MRKGRTLKVLKYLESALRSSRIEAPARGLYHAVLLLLILQWGEIGRKRISEMLGLGEGTVRSLIRRMKDLGLIDTTRKGVLLTEKGKRAVNELRQCISGPLIVKLKELDGGEHSAFILHNVHPSPSDLLEARDEAVRAGGRGALIITFDGERLIFPDTGRGIGEFYPKDEEAILKLLPGGVCTIVIGIPSSPSNRDLVSIAAALKLLGSNC